MAVILRDGDHASRWTSLETVRRSATGPTLRDGDHASLPDYLLCCVIYSCLGPGITLSSLQLFGSRYYVEYFTAVWVTTVTLRDGDQALRWTSFETATTLNDGAHVSRRRPRLSSCLSITLYHLQFSCSPQRICVDYSRGGWARTRTAKGSHVLLSRSASIINGAVGLNQGQRQALMFSSADLRRLLTVRLGSNKDSDRLSCSLRRLLTGGGGLAQTTGGVFDQAQPYLSVQR